MSQGTSLIDFFMPGFPDLKRFLLVVMACPSAILVAESSTPVLASDWGYELPEQGHKATIQTLDTPEPKPDQKKIPQKSLPGKAKPGALSRPSLTKPVIVPSQVDAQLSTQAWLGIYKLISNYPIDDERQDKLRRQLSAKAKERQSQALAAMWPSILQWLDKNPEQTENLGRFLRALIKLDMRKNHLQEPDASIALELLGPDRIAVPGNPALAEDAIDAYCDMVCLLYEVRNEGKTIDATDNRSVLASKISEQFESAPTEKDKWAMANFAVTWARFKIVWQNADQMKRKELLTALESTKTDKFNQLLSHPILDKILAARLWSPSEALKGEQAPSRKGTRAGRG